MSAPASGQTAGQASGQARGQIGSNMGPASAPHREPPGWHGKLPSLGDFASRRLSPEFLATWDGWLASGLQQLRERDPAGWLDAYLANPTRRFLLMPGVLPGRAGQQAWAGVLMPSVDRVGRYFPFTIAQPTALPASIQQMQSLWFWLGRLDDLAADALHDDWTVDRLEAELAHMAGPDLTPLSAALPGLPGLPDLPGLPGLPGLPERPEAVGASVSVALPAGLDINQLIGIEAQALWQQRAQGLAYWYAATDLQTPRLCISRGLPASAASLLGATI